MPCGILQLLEITGKHQNKEDIGLKSVISEFTELEKLKVTARILMQ